MDLDRFIGSMILFYQKNPDAPKEGKILGLESQVYSVIEVWNSDLTRSQGMLAAIPRPYDESGISGCVTTVLPIPSTFGIYTDSEKVVRELKGLGTLELQDQKPYKFKMGNQEYWII